MGISDYALHPFNTIQSVFHEGATAVSTAVGAVENETSAIAQDAANVAAVGWQKGTSTLQYAEQGFANGANGIFTAGENIITQSSNEVIAGFNKATGYASSTVSGFENSVSGGLKSAWGEASSIFGEAETVAKWVAIGGVLLGGVAIYWVVSGGLSEQVDKGIDRFGKTTSAVSNLGKLNFDVIA